MAASAMTGVMNPLLIKLTNLLGDEYKKLTRVRKQLVFLKDELSTMKALLEKMELMDKLDPSAKNWRDHVREMSYDMENCIDDFMHDLDGADATAGFVKKMAKRLKRLGKRHQIANRIEELKFLVVEANARRERYKIDDSVDSSPGVVAVDPRISAIYKEAAGLVGIDGPREELVSLLMDSHKELKVVSIVGFGGLGKTTLAKQVYDKIGEQFNCKAFFSVSQRPEEKTLLIGLQRKLGMEESSHAHELQDIIDNLREYLKYKRYVIVIDDLWEQPSWNTISCAFPNNSNGSRVMVTTRLDDVALAAYQHDTCIYRMKPLEEQDSRRLFYNRVFGSENNCPLQFEEVSAEILSKCGGMPLAVITIASLLANPEARSSLNQWKSIMNYLGAKVATDSPLDEMRGILNLSYIHLPDYLRPCFLYLGMYPEDRLISRNDLVRQWIAEGFVCHLHGVDLEDVAVRYFNELINRSLIQAETRNGEVLYCRVHDMILDLIISKSVEDNFLSVAYTYEDMAIMHSHEYKLRRLSLKTRAGGAISESLATSMSEVRSFARFGECKYTPPLSQFKYLRVLLFEFPYQLDTTINLTAIGHLFLLRYLKVLARSARVALPTKIKGLVHLETLMFDCKSAQSFPSDIARLANLIHLRLPDGTVLPKGIQKMKSVRSMYCSGMSESSLKDIKGLGELTNMKELKLATPYNQRLTVERVNAMVSSIGMLQELNYLSLNCDTDSHERIDALVSSIGMIRDLEYLSLNCGLESQLDSLPDPPLHLEVLDLDRWTFSRVPKWFGKLRCLRIISLRVLHLSSGEVRLLGELPSLVYAKFRVLVVSSQDKVVVSTGLFPVLEEFVFLCLSSEDVSAFLSFEAGAMPKLQKFTLPQGHISYNP